MTKILIKNGRVMDPSRNVDDKLDVLLENGVIAAVEASGSLSEDGAQVIDANGQIVSPGFVEIHCHLREPGFEYKEDIVSGTRSAVFGGFSTVCCMANTRPVNDSAEITQFMRRKASEEGHCRLYPIGSITKGLLGKELAPIPELKEAGCVAISDDGLTVQDENLMRQGMLAAKEVGVPVSTHSIDAELAKHGHMNTSVYSQQKGIAGSPAEAEDKIIARDIRLAEETGAHLHVGHLSTKGGIELVEAAKKKGLKVTCEVTPHHFTIADADIPDQDTNYKMCPPLRSREDVQVIKEAFKRGVIDAIATDHAPHAQVDKQVPFEKASFGIIGFETALPLSLRLVDEGHLTLMQMLDLLTSSPCRVFNLPYGTLKVGAPADVTVFDLEKTWTVNDETLKSKSHNTPFMGDPMKGMVTHTIVGGEVKYHV